MAQQFRAKGHSVAFLGIVESWLPDLSEEPKPWNIETSPGVTYFIKGPEISNSHSQTDTYSDSGWPMV